MCFIYFLEETPINYANSQTIPSSDIVLGNKNFDLQNEQMGM